MPLDLTGQTTGEGLASQFGYGSEYGQYFSPMQEGLLESGTQAGWSGYKQAKRADIFQTGRRGLLDLTQQREMGHGGFAGRGATGREYGRGRSQLSQGLMRGMFGLEQDILGKIGTAQGRIEDWRQGQIGIGLRLAEMEAKKDPLSQYKTKTPGGIIGTKAEIFGTYNPKTGKFEGGKGMFAENLFESGGGKIDIGVYNPETGEFEPRTEESEDVPVGGSMESIIGVYNPETGQWEGGIYN